MTLVMPRRSVIKPVGTGFRSEIRVLHLRAQAASTPGNCMQPFDLFRAIPFLRQVPEEELATLNAQRVEREGGEVFFNQGDPGDAVYGVLTGRVKITKQSARGREVILEVVGPGEVFAAIAALRGIPMPATAVALEPTACVRVNGAAFKTIVDRRPDLASRMLETISRRLLEANTARLDLATEPVEARLARALLRLADKFGARRNDEIVFTQAFTRQNLADLAGTTVETAIRTISRWTKDGIVRSDGGRLTILQPTELRRLVESQGG